MSRILTLFLGSILLHLTLGQTSKFTQIPCILKPFEGEIIKKDCTDRGCIWHQEKCHLSSDYGYNVIDTPSEEKATLKRANAVNTTYFGDKSPDSPQVSVSFSYESDYRLRIRIKSMEEPEERNGFKLDDLVLAYSSPEIPLPPIGSELYKIEWVEEPVYSFKIIRKDTNVALFDTLPGGLTISPQFLQLGVRLPSKNVFGLGEFDHSKLKLDFGSGAVYPMWSLDHPPEEKVNLYGVQPIYMALEDENGNSNAVLFLNSNAQEFELINDPPGYIYRTSGGILDMIIFFGPSPADTTRQISEALGRLDLPPYWSLGFHLNQKSYKDLNEFKEIITRTRENEIPLDVVYADVGTQIEESSFTVNEEKFPGFAEYIKDLEKDFGIRLVIVVNTNINVELISEEDANSTNLWIQKGEVGGAVIGHNDGKKIVVYPDFFDNELPGWWGRQFQKFHTKLPFDGVILSENEPTNFDNYGQEPMTCNYAIGFNSPPFIPQIKDGNLTLHSICPSSSHNGTLLRHKDVHNLYGLASSSVTHNELRKLFGNKRHFLLSRSNFLGSGRFGGHWMPETSHHVDDMKSSVVGMIHYNLFGIPIFGADICGYFNDATEELCARWSSLGAFYPYSRNNKDTVWNEPQDPARWPLVAAAARKALGIRYTLLPYLYGLLFQYKMVGDPVIRPLFFDFPNNPKTFTIDEQFMWGPTLLVSPVLKENTNSVNAYFPKARWFDYNDDGLGISEDGYRDLDTPIGDINVHVKGGHIIPTQEPGLTTRDSRENDFGLLVALDEGGEAEGFLFYDDGETLDTISSGNYALVNYTYKEETLEGKVNGIGELLEGKKLSTIRLMGSEPLESMIVNGMEHAEFIQKTRNREVLITGLNINMNAESFTIKFTFNPNFVFPTTTTEAEETSETTHKESDPTMTTSNEESSTRTTTTTEATTPKDGGDGGGGSRITSFSFMILLFPIFFIVLQHF